MLGKILDLIEVMLLKLDNTNQFKGKLYEEYKLYRNLFEALPRSSNVPDKLYNSVLSLEQRLKDYNNGESSNPLENRAPALFPVITSDDDVTELLEQCKCNEDYINGRKQKIEVLKAYFKEISNSSSKEDILATIELAQKGYGDSNVYSNELEKEIARAKYLYVLKLLYDGEEVVAKEYISTIETDIIIIIYEKHKDSVKKLIDEGKMALAQMLSDFLVDVPNGMEKNIEFWKVLAKIENPSYGQNALNKVSDEDLCQESNESKELSYPLPKKNYWLRFLNFFSRNSFDKDHPIIKDKYSITLTDNGVEIRMKVYTYSVIPNYVFKSFIKDLKKGRSKFPQEFKDVSLIIEELDILISHMQDLTLIGFEEILNEISSMMSINSITIYGLNYLAHGIDSVFFKKIRVTNIKFIGGIWQFDDYSFALCLSIEKIDFSEITLKKLGKYAFQGCCSLKEVIFPKHIDGECYFGCGLFKDCRSLEEVKWPTYIKTIKKDTFLGCTNLKKISTAVIDEVEDRAFEECENLEEVPYSFMIRKIGEKAFYGCRALTRFYFKEGCIVGDYAFESSGIEVANLTIQNEDPPVGVFKNSSIMEATITGSNTLPKETFSGCKELQKVTLDEYMTRIEDAAFLECNILSCINMKRAFSYIGEKAFMNCFKIKDIRISPLNCTIKKCAFMNCQSLRSVRLPPTEDIPKEAFKNCIELEIVEFTSCDAVALSIEDEAFYNCIRLRNFEFRDGIRKIGNNAFEATGLTSVIMPDSISRIGKGAFSNCKFLEKVRISSRVRIINQETFFNCQNLKECYMDDCYIESVDIKAFVGANAIEKLAIGSVLNAYNRIFSKFKSIKELIVPKRLIWSADTEDVDVRKFLADISMDSFVIKDVKIVDDKVHIFIYFYFEKDSNIPQIPLKISRR